MKASLIITTYNWKEALCAVLQTVARQTVMPLEVIVADDGSRSDTAELIQQMATDFPVPLIHSWQEDDGFRLSTSRNKAIAKAKGDYIVMIDGDVLLSPLFISDHIANAKKGFFVQGGRAMLSPELSEQCIKENRLPGFYEKGIKNRKNTLNNPMLSKLFTRIWNIDKSSRGCNMAFWKADLITVNGFNESFTGWGYEDSELAIRLFNIGLQRIYLKFASVCYHLYHNENSRNSLTQNDILLKQAMETKLVWCDTGLDQYL